MQHRRTSSLILLVAGLVLAAACTSSETAPRDGPVVTIFGGYRGVEAQRFAESIAPFEEQTGITVRYTGAGSFAKAIEERVANADYPDIAIFPQPGLIAEYAHQGLLVPLDAATQATVAEYPETAVGVVGDYLQHQAYSFPAGQHRRNRLLTIWKGTPPFYPNPVIHNIRL